MNASKLAVYILLTFSLLATTICEEQLLVVSRVQTANFFLKKSLVFLLRIMHNPHVDCLIECFLYFRSFMFKLNIIYGTNVKTVIFHSTLIRWIDGSYLAFLITAKYQSSLPKEIIVLLEKLLQDEEDANSTKTAIVVAPKWLSHYWLIVSSLIAFQGSILYVFGQPIFSRTGGIRLWSGDIHGRENSQHLTDWYTFTHIIHGIGFYWILGIVLPHYPMQSRSLLAVLLEIFWEIAENTPMIIKRYRQTALANGYSGDSILNSISDTLAMTFGFYLSRSLPSALTVALTLAVELFCAYEIRDNLTLNMLQLIYPLESISNWQSKLLNRENSTK